MTERLPWEKDYRDHPRYAEMLELERAARSVADEMQAIHTRFAEAHDRKVEVQKLIYGDWARTVYVCDECGFRPSRRRRIDVGGWRVWPVDETSGDTRCRCPDCVAEAET